MSKPFCYTHPCRVAAKTVTLRACQAHSSSSSSSFASFFSSSSFPPCFARIWIYLFLLICHCALCRIEQNASVLLQQPYTEVKTGSFFYFYFFLHTVNTWVVYAGVCIRISKLMTSKLNCSLALIQRLGCVCAGVKWRVWRNSTCRSSLRVIEL